MHITTVRRTVMKGIIILKKVNFSLQSDYSFEHIAEAQSHF